MPIKDVNLTPELEHLEHQEAHYEAKLAELRTAIDEGDASGAAAGDVFAHVRETLNLSMPR